MAEPSKATVRGSATPNYGEGEALLAMTNRGEQLIALGVPSKTELVRLGDTWSVQIAAANAFTHVAAAPTTLAQLVLYNGEPGTGKSYVINSVWSVCTLTIAAASNSTLIYQVGDSIAAPTDDTAQLITSPLGHSYGGNAVKDLAVTSMTADKWASLASSAPGAVASVGFGLVAQVDGGIILQPGATLGLNLIQGTAVGKSVIGVNWSEVQF